MKRLRARRHGGFTLVELVITVAIVALLASVAVPVAELAVKRNKESELRESLREIRTAIDDYKRAVDEGRVATSAGASGYPSSLEELVNGVQDIKDPGRTTIYFLRRIPRDPMSSDPHLDAAGTWGKRSYASPPDEPQEGSDVFDVYSLSPGSGINGIEYAKW